jgi:hypothetical protein
MDDRGRSSASATARITAAFACPSTARAWTATTSARPCGPSYPPPTEVTEDPGFTRMGTVAAVESEAATGAVVPNRGRCG